MNTRELYTVSVEKMVPIQLAAQLVKVSCATDRRPIKKIRPNCLKILRQEILRKKGVRRRRREKRIGDIEWRQ
jgi:hypothetical protein